jgi:hypothetical protein
MELVKYVGKGAPLEYSVPLVSMIETPSLLLLSKPNPLPAIFNGRLLMPRAVTVPEMAGREAMVTEFPTVTEEMLMACVAGKFRTDTLPVTAPKVVD